MAIPLEQIAKAAHQTNKAFCEAMGDFSQVDWAQAPENIKNSARDGVKYLRDNPDAKASSLHDNWMDFKIDEGWVYGETKDAEKKTHPCIVPYHQLPPQQKAKDDLFFVISRALLSIK